MRLLRALVVALASPLLVTLAWGPGVSLGMEGSAKAGSTEILGPEGKADDSRHLDVTDALTKIADQKVKFLKQHLNSKVWETFQDKLVENNRDSILSMLYSPVNLQQQIEPLPKKSTAETSTKAKGGLFFG